MTVRPPRHGPTAGRGGSRAAPADPATDDVRAASPDEAGNVGAMHAANRRAWEEAAERYEAWLPGWIEEVRAGRVSLLPVEQRLVGRLDDCRRAVHVQCAGGRHTLSLRLLGAREVVGIDFSPRMLAVARRLSAATGLAATFVEADVLELPETLAGGADLVYTGRGSLMWVQDVDRWAAALAALLAPGGRLVVFEGHPAELLFAAGSDGGWILTGYDYFAGPEASRGWAPAYIDRLGIPDSAQAWKYARAWTLGEVVTAVARSGLVLDELAELPVDWWGGHRAVTPAERSRLPLSFSLTAHRASGGAAADGADRGSAPAGAAGPPAPLPSPG